LQDTAYGESNYYVTNFNDFANSFVVLFCVLHVSGWDVYADGFASVTSKLSGRSFLSLWYCFGVLLFMNVITAFFMCEFIVSVGSESSPTSSKKATYNPKNMLVLQEQSIRRIIGSRLTDVGADDMSMNERENLSHLLHISLRYSFTVNSWQQASTRELLIAARQSDTAGVRFQVRTENVHHLDKDELAGVITRMRSGGVEGGSQ
jgi:hypothetical protein